MSKRNDFIDRMAPIFPAPERPFERFLRRRERKIRNRRIRAGALGLGLMLAGILVASSVTRTGSETGHHPSPSPGTPGVRTFAQVHGWIAYRSGAELKVVDPLHPNEAVVLEPQPEQEFLLGPVEDTQPIAWSADGTRLLLRSDPQVDGFRQPSDVYALRSDGSLIRLVDYATWGSFSPDGTQVVYASDGGSTGPAIVDAGGGRPREVLPSCPDDLCGEPVPEAAAWSPDGTRIAWVDFVEDSARYGHHATTLSFVNPDGSNLQTEVAELPGGGWDLVWSPDGSRLAFSDADLDRPGKIYVINADGSGVQRLTHGGDDRWPTWSPDGSRIAFVRDGILHTMAADGSDVRSLRVEVDGTISWNPIG